jgi:recombinational DNA repair protein (RecF pathway)
MARTRSLTPPIRFIVLTTMPLGERDTLLRVVEESCGIRPIILRGARPQPTSSPRRSASWKSLDLFDRAVGSFSLRPAGITNLASFERCPAFGSLRTDLTKFGAAHTIAEATLVLFNEQSETDSALYDRIEASLDAINLAESPRDTFRLLTEALAGLLTVSGFGLPMWESGLPPLSPRLLREITGTIERVTNKPLRTAPTLWQLIDRLPPRES